MREPVERADATEDGSCSVGVGELLMGFKSRKDKKWTVSRTSNRYF